MKENIFCNVFSVLDSFEISDAVDSLIWCSFATLKYCFIFFFTSEDLPVFFIIDNCLVLKRACIETMVIFVHL